MIANPPTADTWWVEVFVGETDGLSTATARLHTRARTSLSAHGTARLSSSDEDVPEIGYELATARALAALARQLLEAAADDIGEVTHDLVSVTALERDPTVEDPTVADSTVG